MSTAKEALLSRLLQPEGLNASSSKPANNLIQEVGADTVSAPVVEVLPPPPPTTAPTVAATVKAVPVDEGPSILEMMMAAHREANAEVQQTKATEQTVASQKPLGAGFKKGFFGGGTKTESKKTEAKVPGTQKKSGDVVEVKKAGDKQSNPLVFDDVQKAMEEDQHPLLKQLKQNGTCSFVSNVLFIVLKNVSNHCNRRVCCSAVSFAMHCCTLSPISWSVCYAQSLRMSWHFTIAFIVVLTMHCSTTFHRLDHTRPDGPVPEQHGAEPGIPGPQVHGGHAAAADQPQGNILYVVCCSRTIVDYSMDCNYLLMHDMVIPCLTFHTVAII